MEWLLLIRLIQVYNDKKKKSKGQKEVQKVQFRGKRSIKKLSVTAKGHVGREAAITEETSSIDERPALHWNNRVMVLTFLNLGKEWPLKYRFGSGKSRMRPEVLHF